MSAVGYRSLPPCGVLPLKGLSDSHIIQALTGDGGRSGGERAAACSAVKATASRCRELKFAAALTASARCRNRRHDRHLFAQELPSRAFPAHQLARRGADQPPSSPPTLEVGACGRRGTELTRTEVSIMAAARSPPDRPAYSAAPSFCLRSRSVHSIVRKGEGNRAHGGVALSAPAIDRGLRKSEAC